MFLKNLPYCKKRQRAYKRLSDEELVLEYKESNQQQMIGELFDRYVHLVFANCMKYFKNEDNAQDATMEIFEFLPGKLLKYEIKFFKSWLYTTTRNYCLMQLRRKNIYEFLPGSEDLVNKTMEFEYNENLINEHNDDEQIVRDCLAELKEEQQLCVELMYIKGLSYKAISENTGFEQKKVKSYIQNGKRNLKLKLEQYYERQSRE